MSTKSIFENSFVRVTRSCYYDGMTFKTHSHENDAISLVLRGKIHETVEGKTIVGGATKLIIKPTHIPHKNFYLNNCTIMCVYLKEKKHNKLLDYDVLKEWDMLNGNNSVHFFNNLISTSTEEQYYSNLKKVLSYIKYQKINTKKEIIPDWLIYVKSYLDENWQNIQIRKDLRKEFKLNPIYISKVFRNYYGQSIQKYLKTLRISNTMANMIHDDSCLSQIALSNGFSDQSHMGRSFKKITGFTPLEFKKII